MESRQSFAKRTRPLLRIGIIEPFSNALLLPTYSNSYPKTKKEENIE